MARRSGRIGGLLHWIVEIPVPAIVYGLVAGLPWYEEPRSIAALAGALLLAITLDVMTRPLRSPLSSAAVAIAWSLLAYLVPVALFAAAVDPGWFRDVYFYAVFGLGGLAVARTSMAMNRLARANAAAPRSAPLPASTVQPQSVPHEQPARRFNNPFWNDEDRDHRLARKQWAETFVTVLLIFLLLAVCSMFWPTLNRFLFRAVAVLLAIILIAMWIGRPRL